MAAQTRNGRACIQRRGGTRQKTPWVCVAFYRTPFYQCVVKTQENEYCSVFHRMQRSVRVCKHAMRSYLWRMKCPKNPIVAMNLFRASFWPLTLSSNTVLSSHPGRTDHGYIRLINSMRSFAWLSPTFPMHCIPRAYCLYYFFSHVSKFASWNLVDTCFL